MARQSAFGFYLTFRHSKYIFYYIRTVPLEDMKNWGAKSDRKTETRSPSIECIFQIFDANEPPSPPVPTALLCNDVGS